MSHAADASHTAAHYLRPGTLQLRALPPLSLYVHLPWCLKKCPYCDFNSHESAGGPPTRQYLEALRADLEAALPLIWGRRIESIFIGGGTPSLFEPAAIEQLLSDLRARLMVSAQCEITLEANPGTFERERFKAYRQAGVTRLSIGVQSFDDAKLRALGRVHDRHQALAAVEEAAQAFDTFNLDLMYALPGQSLADLHSDLQQALAFEPPHLSVYHLTIEPNTWFASRPPPGLPDDDTAYAMLDAITEATARIGMQRYEVSAYARAGHASRHNMNYWQFGDYLGIGAGAHSKLSFPHRVLRFTRWREPQTYMDQAVAGQAVSGSEDLSRSALAFEFMLNALRLREGFALAQFGERTGLPLSAIDAQLEQALRQGLLEYYPGPQPAPAASTPQMPSDASSSANPAAASKWIRATPKGFDFLSDLQALFLHPG